MQRGTAIRFGGASPSGSNPHHHDSYREEFPSPASVRTNRPILKSKLKEATLALVCLKAKPPVKIGQVILPNLLNSGVDVVATDDLFE